MKLFRTVLAILLLAAYGSVANAQTLPKPKEFYFDQDAAAKPIVVVEGEGEALAQALMRERDRGRKQVEATAQLAGVAMASGRIDLGRSLFGQALAESQASSTVGRSVRWNYAWALHRNGDTTAALGYWSELAGSYGALSWVPPTLALALWNLDRKAEAVRWYAAAARTEPVLWGNPANYPKLLPQWRQQDRDVLAEVHAAWLQNPPGWP